MPKAGPFLVNLYFDDDEALIDFAVIDNGLFWSELPADPAEPAKQDPGENVQEGRKASWRGCYHHSANHYHHDNDLSPHYHGIKVLEEEMTSTEEDIDIVGVEKKEAAEEERRMKAAVAKVA